ncbi:MAG: ABC transporter permease [Spirochaetota bacterium]
MAANGFAKRFLARRATFTIIAFVALLAFFGLFTTDRNFFRAANMTALARLAPDLGIVALGVGMLMIAGEFDLSIAATIPLSSFVFVKLLGWNVPLGLVLGLTLASGLVVGCINGLMVARTHLPSFIVTLGTLLFWRGLIFAASRMMPIGLRGVLEEGSWLDLLFGASLWGAFPVQFLWFLFFALLLGLLVHFHTFGNWVYVTGDNETAARAMGIETGLVKIICYMMVGFLASFVGMVQNLRIESFAANQGVGFELKAIASSVVGGTSLMGGIGSIPGIFLGTLTIQIIENGLILMGAPPFGISAFIGAAIILFAVLNANVARISGREE